MSKWPKQLLAIVKGCKEIEERKERYMSGQSDDDPIDQLKQLQDPELDPFREIKEKNRLKKEEEAKRRLEHNDQVTRVYRLKEKK